MIETLIDTATLLALFDERARQAGSYYQLAKDWGFPRQEISAVRNGKRIPKRVLNKLGIEPVLMFRAKAD